MSDYPLTLGIVGCGWAASEIVRAAAGLPRLRVSAAYDVDRARAETLARTAGAEPRGTLEALLADDALDIIYVGLPHHLLAATVERCLVAGKHVIAEKPLALSPAGALRLGELAKDRSLKLSVFFELRCTSAVEQARKLVQAGAIGEPRLLRVRTLIDKPIGYWGMHGALNWRAGKSTSGGGVLLMNSIHQLDTIRFVTGLEFTRASGEIGTFTTPADVEDSVSATFRLSNGALLSLVAAAHCPGAQGAETIEIDGTIGRLDLPDPYHSGALRLFRKDTGAWDEFPAQPVDSHALMIEAFLKAVDGGGPVPVLAADAAAAVAAVQAVYRSAAEGSAVEIRL